MRKLLFLNRVAFICNIFFLACLYFQRTSDFISSQDLKGLLIILGWAIAPVLNLIIGVWASYLFLKKKELHIPFWLLFANQAFLLFQFLYHTTLA